MQAAAPATPLAPDPAEAAACDSLLAGGTVKAIRLPSMPDTGGCGIAVPVRLAAFALPGRSDVTLEPPVLLRCQMAGVLADWIRNDLVPLAAGRGGGLAKLVGVGGYECRGRNRVVGAKLSEHALGNALDIDAFVFKDGSVAKVTDVPNNEALFSQVKLTTCARFSTVLGPGSDGYHETHMHIDIETRRKGSHYCHWQLP